MKGDHSAYQPSPLEILFKIICVLTMISITIPLAILAITSFNSTADLIFPPSGLSVRWFIHIFEREGFINSFKLSLLLGLVSSFFSLSIGSLFSYALVRYRFFGKNLLNLLILSPLIIPEVVTGIAFLFFLSKIRMYYVFINLMILHVIMTLPFTVRVIYASLLRFDISLEEAALSLGANRIKTFLKITIPLIKEGIITAFIFSFVVSFNNFTATLFIVSRQATLPVEIFTYIMNENDPTIAAISTLIIFLTVIFVIISDKVIGLEKITARY
jgi:putative spermidine/putrescine transport system permease protein